MKKVSNYVWVSFCVAISFLFSTFQGGLVFAQSKERISICTGGSGGVFYIIGAGMAKAINKHVPWLDATAQSTAATVENIELVNAGKGDFATCIYDRVIMAHHGIDAYKGKARPNIRLGVGGHYGAHHYVTLSKSGIKSIADIKGKKLAIPPSQDPYEMYGNLFGPHGIKKGDYKLIPMSYSEMIVALKDGTIDVANIIAGIPVSSVMDIVTTHQIHFIAMTEQDVSNFTKNVPAYYRFVIPANTYKGQTADHLTIAGGYVLLAGKHVSEKTAYAVAKTILENTNEIKEVHPEGKYWQLEHPIYKDIPPKIPYHPGFEKYLREKKVIN